MNNNYFKHLTLTCLIFFNFMYPSPPATDHKPLLVILLMVKNEEDVMQKTLQPYIDAGIDSYLILDTGSTDKTIEVTKQLFEQYNIQHGYIIEQPFVDFAASRNYAIEQAEKIFSRASFFFMIDAEWYISDVPALLEFCKQNQRSKETSFFTFLQPEFSDNGNEQPIGFYTHRLFQPHRGVHFTGVVHETLSKATFMKKTPDSIFITYRPDKKGREATKNRWFKDKDLLLQEHKKNPKNSRTIFYIAQTYACLDDFENACEWYSKRCNMSQDEEAFMACYQCAKIYENHFQDTKKAILYYLQASRLRPTRAEPLIDLARIYLQAKNYKLCFDMIIKALQIPYPKSDIHDINRTYYTYTRYDILGAVASYVGNFELGKQAILLALQARPDEPHLLKNLAFYNNILSTKLKR